WHFIYVRATSPAVGGIYLGSIDSKPGEQSMKKLLPDLSTVAFAETSAGSGSILFLRGSTLMVQSFNTKRMELAGEAVPIADQVSSAFGTNNFSVSATGTLVYRIGGSPAQQLTWFDRHGKSLEAVGEPAIFAPNSAPAISPDGKRLAI